MLQFPVSTQFGRRIPKQKFYQNLEVSPEIKRVFVEQVRLITWANKLSSETMNVDPGETVQEIEVFQIRMAGETLDDRVLQVMYRQIPYHLLFVLERPDGQQCLRIAYKEAGERGTNVFHWRQSYRTEWSAPEDLTLHLSGLNMDTLYENIVRQIAGDILATDNTAPLSEAVATVQEREKLQKQIAQLKNRMRKEKQLARQMELRREIQKLEGKT